MKNNQVNRIFLRGSFLEADGKSEPAEKSPEKKGSAQGSAYAQKLRPGQRSCFLMLTMRSAASEDEMASKALCGKCLKPKT